VAIPTLALLLGQALVAVPPPLVLSLGVFFLTASFVLRWREKRKWFWVSLFSVATFSLGYALHYRLLNPRFAPDHLRRIADEGEPLYIEGRLDREPERLPDRSRWYLRAERIWLPHGAAEAQGKILITVRAAAREWHYHDRVRFWLSVRQPRRSGNPGGFDYEPFLARRQIYLTGYLQSDAGVELVRREMRGPWGGIEYLRRELRRFLESRLPSEHAALMKALIVGDMGGISQEMRGDFTAAGVAHVLSISGLHVAMLGLVVFFLIRFLGSLSVTLMLRWNLFKIATLFSFLAVLFYTALAGAMIPTVRSAIMIGVYELAVLLDREEETFAGLAFAALLIGLIWPGVVMDISFQLSFLAVLFIIWGLREIEQRWPARRRNELPQERGWLRRRLRPAVLYLAVPVLATIGTWPMIAYHFGHLSLAGFLSNPIIVPLVGFVVVPVGLLIGFLSLVAPALTPPFLRLAEPLLSLTQVLVRFFSHLPLANLPVPSPNLLEVGILHLALCSLLSLRGKRGLIIAAVSLSLAIAGDGLYWWQQRWRREELRVTFLDVGQGDAAVVEFPGSKVLLIDAGGTPSGEFDSGESIIAPFLRSRKILKVDYLLVSHPRIDHYGGMKTIVREFAPSELWSGPSKGRTIRYEGLEEAVARSGVKRVFLNSRDPCRSIEQASLCVLYPPEGKAGGASAVLRLSFGKVHILFAGDVERRDERLLLHSAAGLSSAVLKVPRHGSSTSSTEEFVAAVKPKLAIFSVGQRNPFGLPREEVISRYRAAGSRILRTDQDGAITVETDGERVRYWTYRSRRKGEIGP